MNALFVATLVMAQVQAPTVEDIRATTRSLLGSLCGAQCDVIDVEVKLRAETPVGAIAPGFDEPPGQRKVPSSIALTLLFDQKLKPAFRKFVTERVRHRVGELGLPVTIAQKTLPFQEPPSPPVDETDPAAAPSPASPPPQPIVIQPPAAPTVPRPEASELLVLRLIESVPLFLLALLLAGVIAYVLRQLSDLRNPPTDLEEDDEPPAGLETPPLATEVGPISQIDSALPLPSIEVLTSDLNAHRSSTRRVFRDALLSRDQDRLVKAIALLGDFVVRDLAADPSTRGSLLALRSKFSEITRAPVPQSERDEILRWVHSELTADRVAHRREDLRPETERLLGLGPEAFSSLVDRVDDRLRVVLLRHAPRHLMESHLAGLNAKRRGQLVNQILVAPPTEPHELATLAEALEAESDAAEVGGREADRIVDLLDTLSAAEQDAAIAVLQKQRPEFIQRNLGQLPVESALLSVPASALGYTWTEVSIERWIEYLRTAPDAIRARAMSACPERLRAGVLEELGLRVVPNPAAAAEARREIVRCALRAPVSAANATSAKALASGGRAPDNRGIEEDG